MLVIIQIVLLSIFLAFPTVEAVPNLSLTPFCAAFRRSCTTICHSLGDNGSSSSMHFKCHHEPENLKYHFRCSCFRKDRTAEAISAILHQNAGNAGISPNKPKSQDGCPEVRAHGNGHSVEAGTHGEGQRKHAKSHHHQPVASSSKR